MSQKERKRKSKERLHIPVPEALGPEPHIEMIGNREIIIDGCKGVVEYDENLIKLNTGELVISFTGFNLLIKSFDSDVAVITGEISEIGFVS